MRPAHIYVHVPFCARRCVYCDFSIAVRKVVPVDEYLTALARELDVRFPGDDPWPVETLYFGGGTPSHLGSDGVGRMMELFRARIQLAAGAEVTIEANPDDTSAADAAVWRAAGINRVSLGAQTFDDATLAWMHRVHGAAEIDTAFAILRDAGFSDVSLDLIFALPASLKRDWRRDLERAVAMDPTHISLYGLTIEPHAPLGRWVARGDAIEAPEERYESEFLLADELLARAGFEHYEVSNFAKPGHRARHNFSYWRGVPYAGLGPGAHEYDGRCRRWNVGSYADWVRRLAAGTDPREGDEELTQANRVAEAVYLGLRTANGLELAPGEADHVARWVDAGWARIEGSTLSLTPMGWLRLDSLAADLTLLRSH